MQRKTCASHPSMMPYEPGTGRFTRLGILGRYLHWRESGQAGAVAGRS